MLSLLSNMNNISRCNIYLFEILGFFYFITKAFNLFSILNINKI
jgi:hypothetical protein